MKRSSDAYEWEIQGDCSNGVNSTTYFNSETSSLCFALLSAIIRFQPKKIFTLSWAFSRWLEKLKSCWKKIAFDSLSEKTFRFFFLSSTLGEIEKHNLSTLHVKFPLNSFLMIKTKNSRLFSYPAERTPLIRLYFVVVVVAQQRWKVKTREKSRKRENIFDREHFLLLLRSRRWFSSLPEWTYESWARWNHSMRKVDKVSSSATWYCTTSSAEREKSSQHRQHQDDVEINFRKKKRWKSKIHLSTQFKNLHTQEV